MKVKRRCYVYIRSDCALQWYFRFPCLAVILEKLTKRANMDKDFQMLWKFQHEKIAYVQMQYFEHTAALRDQELILKNELAEKYNFSDYQKTFVEFRCMKFELCIVKLI